MTKKVTAGETSHGHFYYSILQDFILERADKCPDNWIVRLPLKSIFNSVFALSPAAQTHNLER